MHGGSDERLDQAHQTAVRLPGAGPVSITQHLPLRRKPGLLSGLVEKVAPCSGLQQCCGCVGRERERGTWGSSGVLAAGSTRRPVAAGKRGHHHFPEDCERLVTNGFYFLIRVHVFCLGTIWEQMSLKRAVSGEYAYRLPEMILKRESIEKILNTSTAKGLPGSSLWESHPLWKILLVLPVVYSIEFVSSLLIESNFI